MIDTVAAQIGEEQPVPRPVGHGDPHPHRIAGGGDGARGQLAAHRQGRGRPVRHGGAGELVGDRRCEGHARLQSGYGQGGDHGLAVDRHAERAAHRRIGQRALLRRSEGEAEQSRRRIEGQPVAGQAGGAGDRQIADRAASDQIGLVLGKAGDRERRGFAAQKDIGRFAFADLLVLDHRWGEAHLAVTFRGNDQGAGADTAHQYPHLRLGKQLEHVRARPAKADLEHLVGHRDHVLDGAQDGLQRVPAGPARRGAQPRRDLLGGDRTAVRPLRAADAESVAHAVVRHDPALRQRRLDLAGTVEAAKALGGRLDKEGRRSVERLEIGIPQLRGLADRAHPDRTGLAFVAARQRQCRGGERQPQERSHRHRPSIGSYQLTSSSPPGFF